MTTDTDKITCLRCVARITMTQYEKQMRHDKFIKGSGCYECRSCGKQTRDTGEGEVSARLCLSCWNAAGLENEHNDGHHEGNPNPDCPMCNEKEDNMEETKKGWAEDQILDEGARDKVKLLYNCPDCGENRLSHLHRSEDDVSVDCASCGTVYVPEFEAEKQIKEVNEMLSEISDDLQLKMELTESESDLVNRLCILANEDTTELTIDEAAMTLHCLLYPDGWNDGIDVEKESDQLDSLIRKLARFVADHYGRA